MEFERVFYVEGMPLKLDKKLLLTRLSFKKSKTELSTEIMNKIDEISNTALSLSNPLGAYKIVHLSQGNDNLLYIDDLKISNKFLSDKTVKACAAVFLSVTLGSTIDAKINELFSVNEYTNAVILDAAASCIADSAVDALKNSVDKQLSSEGLKTCNFRISPWQAMLCADLQKIIYDKLSLNKIGIHINEKMMLTPQKSVISLTGIVEKN